MPHLAANYAGEVGKYLDAVLAQRVVPVSHGDVEALQEALHALPVGSAQGRGHRAAGAGRGGRG